MITTTPLFRSLLRKGTKRRTGGSVGLFALMFGKVFGQEQRLRRRKIFNLKFKWRRIYYIHLTMSLESKLENINSFPELGNLLIRNQTTGVEHCGHPSDAAYDPARTDFHDDFWKKTLNSDPRTRNNWSQDQGVRYGQDSHFSDQDRTGTKKNQKASGQLGPKYP